MGPHVPEGLSEVTSLWSKGKRMESAPKVSSPNQGSAFSGPGYLRKVTRSCKTRLTNGKRGEKAHQKKGASLEDAATNSDNTMSDSSSGITVTFMGAENADGESLPSQSSLTSESAEMALKVQVMGTLISNLFSTISTLKSAYVELQSAHVPYDPEKLQVADKAVIAELKRLSELKHSYNERLAIILSGQVGEKSQDFTEVEANDKEGVILKGYEGIISNFHSEIQKKSALAENLKDMLAQTTLKKEKLDRRVKRLEQRLAKGYPANSLMDLSPTPQLLECMLLGASESSRSFTKLLTSLMKVAEWDLDAAANSIEPGMIYTRRAHKKFAFESYVNHRMLNGFESENFFVTSNLSTVLDPEKNIGECFKEFQELRFADPAEVIAAKPQSMFSKYCLKKYLDLVHPKMEDSFFGNMDHRKQVVAGAHPTSQFYQSFLKLAKAMWLVHRLAFSFEPNARIFQVQREMEFSPLYMESIVQLGEHDASSAGVTCVGFTVMPGFRVEKTVLKCQVYLMEIPHTDTEEG